MHQILLYHHAVNGPYVQFPVTSYRPISWYFQFGVVNIDPTIQTNQIAVQSMYTIDISKVAPSLYCSHNLSYDCVLGEYLKHNRYSIEFASYDRGCVFVVGGD